MNQWLSGMGPRLRAPSEDAFAAKGRLGRAVEALELVVEVRVDAEPPELREGKQPEDPEVVGVPGPREHDVDVGAGELAVGGPAQVQQGIVERVALGREVRDAGAERPGWKAATGSSLGACRGGRKLNCTRRASRRRRVELSV